MISNKQTPLLIALTLVDTTIAYRLMNDKRCKLTECNSFGFNALMIASRFHDFETVSKLYNTKSFDINAQSTNGLSVLHWICRRPIPRDPTAAQEEIENGQKIFELYLNDPKIDINLTAESVELNCLFFFFFFF